MKYHICFLQYDLRGGGAERKVCTLADYFVSQGHQVEIGLYGTKEIAYSLDPRVKVTFINRENYEYSGPFERKIYNIKNFLEDKVLAAPLVVFDLLRKKTGINFLPSVTALRFKNHFYKKHNYTEAIQNFFYNRPKAVFITMMISSYVAIMEVIGKEYGGKISNPLYVMDCNDPKHNAPGELKDKRDKLYPLATRSVVQTRGAKEYFSQEVQKNMVIIPNPIKEGLPSRYEGERRKVIVNYCRLNVQKNLPCLIKAFAKFHKEFSDYSLEIYGKGELEEELNALIKDLNIEKCASILDFDPNIHKKIRDVAMFVSSSNWEGFPNSIAEAMSIGLPTISTNCDFGPSDLIKDHINGILVSVDDENELCNAMLEVARDPQLMERLSREGQRLREVYNVCSVGEQWISLIEDSADLQMAER